MIAPIARLPDWRPRLNAWLAEVARRPFAPGTHDCALFVAGAVAAMTGIDLAAEYRGRYRTVKGGLKALSKAGLADHAEAVRQHFAAVHPAFAGVGDIAVIDMQGDLPALGIFEGQHIAVAGPVGLGFVPRERATAAWKVP